MRPSRAAALAIAGSVGILVVVFWPFRTSNTSSPGPAHATGIAQDRPEVESSSIEPLLQHPGEDPGRVQVLPSGPHGRVIDAGSGEPVSGLTVRLRFGRKVLAEAIAGEDGGFALPRPERSRRVVDVHTEGWRTSPARIRLDEAQSAGESELLFEAERIVSAPVRGALTDARTGDVVPDFLIQVRGPLGMLGERNCQVGQFAFSRSIIISQQPIENTLRLILKHMFGSSWRTTLASGEVIRETTSHNHYCGRGGGEG